MPAASFTDKFSLGQNPNTFVDKPRVVVTGGSGKLGIHVVAELVEHGWDVVNFDRAPPKVPTPGSRFHLIDLTDMGQVIESLIEVDGRYKGVQAVVHLAALPAPGQTGSSFQFHNNTMGVYNILEACRKLNIKTVVVASSETLVGIPFVPHRPAVLPITEETERRPESAYSLSKLVGETMAEQYARWDPELSIYSLRFSNVQSPEDYVNFSKWQGDAQARYWNAWGYIDARDGGQAVRLCLEKKIKGHTPFIIANEETVMEMSSAELCKAVFPDVPYKPVPGLGPNATVLSIEKAKKLLGYKPKYKWTEEAKKLAQ